MTVRRDLHRQGGLSAGGAPGPSSVGGEGPSPISRGTPSHLSSRSFLLYWTHQLRIHGAEGPGNAKPLRGEAACAVCLRNREKGILEKCSECLRDASTEVGEGALSQVVLRFAGRVDILDLTPGWKGRCWGWGQWLVE